MTFPTGSRDRALGRQLLHTHPVKETRLTYGSRKIHRSGSLGCEGTETPKKGHQGQACSKAGSLLWPSTDSAWIKPCSCSAASTSRQAWRLTRMDFHPLKARCLPPASMFHSRKQTKLPLVYLCGPEPFKEAPHKVDMTAHWPLPAGMEGCGQM